MKNFVWKVKQFLIGTFDDDAKWWCSNCGWLPSHCNDIMKENNPHYCPQCGAKIMDCNKELPLAEPDITEQDWKENDVSQIYVYRHGNCDRQSKA